MTNPGQPDGQPIGLDVGTSRIVVARNWDKQFRYEAQLSAFLTLPFSKLTVSLLERERVLHEVQESEIVVAGDQAQKFAEMFRVETRRPVVNGTLNPQEPHSASVVRQIVTRLLGPAARPGQRVYYSVPAPPGAGEAGAHYAFHKALIRQILAGLGYEGTPIDEGLAVVFGELGSSNFTGLGVSCGSGLCNVCLAVLSLPVVTFSAPRAGDFIDLQTAIVTGEPAGAVRAQKERSFQLNGFTGDRVQNALVVFYDEVIAHLAEAVKNGLSSTQRLPRFEEAIPVVVAGGSAIPEGFVERFAKALKERELPIRISEVRCSPDPLNATARGALTAALC